MGKTKIVIRYDKLDYCVELMRALAHPLRLKLLEFIDGEGKTHVRKIYRTLELEQSITSQHLGVLRNAGVLKFEKEGKFKYYSIDYDVVSRANRAVNNFLKKEQSWLLAKKTN